MACADSLSRGSDTRFQINEIRADPCRVRSRPAATG